MSKYHTNSKLLREVLENDSGRLKRKFFLTMSMQRPVKYIVNIFLKNKRVVTIATSRF